MVRKVFEVIFHLSVGPLPANRLQPFLAHRVTHRRNQLCKISYWSVKGFRLGRCLKIANFHRKAWSSLTLSVLSAACRACTWPRFSQYPTSAELLESERSGFSLLSFTRPVSPVIILKLSESELNVCNNYRPPPSSVKVPWLNLWPTFRHLYQYHMLLLTSDTYVTCCCWISSLLAILIFILMTQKIQMPSNFSHFLILATLLNLSIFLPIAVIMVWISSLLLHTLSVSCNRSLPDFTFRSFSYFC
jgi:hypothetical protein